MKRELCQSSPQRSEWARCRVLAAMAAFTGAIGCTGGGSNGNEPLAEVRAAILNGNVVQPFPNGTPAYSKAIVNINGCTGTLIDPQWVLTTSSGLTFNDEPCFPNLQVGQTVTSIRPSGNVTRTIDRIERHSASSGPDDGALLHLAAPINDVPPTQLYWGATSAIVGKQQVTCYGYGANATAGSCTSNATCPAGFSCFGAVCQSFTGNLTSATMNTRAEPDTVNHPGTFDVLLNSSNQALLAGDMGGPCYYQGQLAAIASSYYGTDRNLSSAAVIPVENFRAWMVATIRGQRTRLFQGVENNVVYFLDAANQLWREVGSSSNKTLVDSNVRNFHAVNSSAVYVLGLDNNLWNEQPDQNHRTQVDSNVRTFQGVDTTNVLVLGNDGNLWAEVGTFQNRTQVDGTVLNFHAVGALAGAGQHIYVLGTNQFLWNESGSSASRTRVDTTVADFSPVDGSRVYVLGNDFNLWNELGTFLNRTQVDANVLDLQGIDSSVVYVLGQDNNLWRENGTSQNRTLVDSSVLRFQAMDATTVYVMGQDGNLWRETGTFANRTLVDHR
jgi:Trypsin